MPRTALSEYHKKRDFSLTNEPRGTTRRASRPTLEFVIQKHGARRLHYDFRLELDGVMKSWAVTRGPSYDPDDKRLAVRTEDHPMEYNYFEGVIPARQYGAGPVMIWDQGTWSPDEDPHLGLAKGHLTFHIDGTRMHGKWHLVRMHTKEKRENWLLIKSDDEYAMQGKPNTEFLDTENTSAVSGRTLDEIEVGITRKSSRGKTRQKKSKPEDFAALQKKYGNVELATLVEYPPTGKDWLHEIKYDGYRMLAFIKNGSVLLQTRGKHDWTRKFPGLVTALAQLPVKDAVLDGEFGVLDDRGRTSFGALQEALSTDDDANIEGWFFDLLHLDGEDYSAKPLVERKTALQKILPKKSRQLHFSAHFESGPKLLEEACKVGAEGLVSKLKDSAYRGRRTRDWVKSKCGLEQEFVIGGFMPAQHNAQAVGSLLLGYYKNGKLQYAGKVGTGFSQSAAQDLHERLAKLKTAQSPFPGKVERGRREYVWVRPEQLCEVSFWEWTADKHIRHAVFKGLREDKAPREVHEEKAEAPPKGGKSTGVLTVDGVVITHPEREVFPGAGITKGDVVEYYRNVMDYLFPFVEGRLLSLMRCTETIAGECFFQRAPMKGGRGNVTGFTSTHKGSKHTYLYTDSPAGVIELVQMNTIEFHAWQSRVDDINKPDQLIFDLDPAENVPFAAVKLAAQDVRQRLKTHGLQSFPRLTGGKGIHIVAPITPNHEWAAIKKFAQQFAQVMQRDTPQAYTANMSKAKRVGKIFIDYLRNDYSATAIVPFSLRARPGAPIAVPLNWSELEKVESAHAYAYANHKEILNVRLKKNLELFFSTRQELKI